MSRRRHKGHVEQLGSVLGEEFSFNPCVILAGAGLSRLLTENLKQTYPLVSDILSDQYLSNEYFVRETFLVDFPTWYSSHESAFVQFMVRDIGASFVKDKGWVDPASSDITNYESVYSHLLSLQDGSYSTHKDLARYKEARRIFDAYLAGVLDVANYDTFNINNRLSNYLSRFPDRTLLFSTNQDNILEHYAQETSRYPENGWEPLYNEFSLGDLSGLVPRKVSGNKEPRIGTVFTKLHGSISWRSCSNSNCPEYHVPIVASTYSYIINSTIGRATHTYYCRSCGSVMFMEIMPPVSMKQYDLSRMYSRQLRKLWIAIKEHTIWLLLGTPFQTLMECSSLGYRLHYMGNEHQ